MCKRRTGGRGIIKKVLSCCLAIVLTCSLFPEVASVSTRAAENETEQEIGGLDAKATGFWVEEAQEGYWKLGIDVTLTNWTMNTLSLKDNVSGVFFCNEVRLSEAEMDFDGETQIRMLEELTGTLEFTLPVSAAFVKEDDTAITITLKGREITVDCPYETLTADLRREHESSPAGIVEKSQKPVVLLGDFTFADSWEGREEPRYSWLLQEFELVNGSSEDVRTEGLMSAWLYYQEIYEFEAQIRYDEDILGPHEECSGVLAFLIPGLVRRAEEGMLEYRISLQGDEWTAGIGTGGADTEPDTAASEEEPEPVTAASEEETEPVTAAPSGTALSDMDLSGFGKVGNIVEFGVYEQDGSSWNGPEPIRWRVLEVEGEKALVISEYALEVKPYHDKYEREMSWEKCSLRKWLNEDFLEKAFTEEEQSVIALSLLSNDDNLTHGTDGGNNTEDWIFLLSLAEVDQYFGDKDSNQASATRYAAEHGAFVQESNNRCIWWLRSPGIIGSYAACISCTGSVDTIGYYILDSSETVRPAMRINISGSREEDDRRFAPSDPSKNDAFTIKDGANLYQLSNGELKLTQHNEETDIVYIPESVNGYPVTSIGEHAFANTPDVQYLVLPPGLRTLDAHSLEDIKELKEIVMPESVGSIGNYAICKIVKAVCVKGSFSWNYMRYVAEDLVDGDELSVRPTEAETSEESGDEKPEMGESLLEADRLTGLTFEEATEIIHSLGLYYEMPYQEKSDTVPFGRIIRWEPSNGKEELKEGDTVKLFISTGE